MLSGRVTGMRLKNVQQGKLHAVLDAGVVYYNLMRIHLFYSGNGRGSADFGKLD